MKVLVLNNANQPINVTTLSRGFKLVFLGKAEVVAHDAEKPIVTERRTYKRPTVIRLLRYVFVPFKKVALTRQNIYRRDDHKCVYCGSNEDLTLDHVHPKSRGGGNTWQNLVTACGPCNVWKADRTPREANMEMRHEPFRPTFLYFVEKIANVHESWKSHVGIVID